MNKFNHKWIFTCTLSCESCSSTVPKKISVWRPSTILNPWWAWPFNVTLLFFKSYCNAPLNSIKLRMCNLIYIILIPLIAGFTRFTLKSLNRFSFKSIQQNFMVFAESIKLLTFSEIKYLIQVIRIIRYGLILSKELAGNTINMRTIIYTPRIIG